MTLHLPSLPTITKIRYNTPMKNDFNLCPMCGSKNIQNKNDRKWFCPDCGFDLYCNVAASVGVLIFDDDKNFLFEKRAKEPKKGLWTQPGGFIDADESAEDAVERECMEELGARVTDIRYLGSYPNTYEYKKITYKTCDMFFTAKIAGESADGGEGGAVREGDGCNAGRRGLKSLAVKLNAQKSEVEEVVVQKINSAAEIDSLPLAFVSTKNALRDFFARDSGREGDSEVSTRGRDFSEGDELLWI